MDANSKCRRCSGSCFFEVRWRLARLPVVDEKAIQPGIDCRLVLDPDAMLLVVAWISIVAADVHQLAVDAHNLRMRIQVLAFLVAGRPGPLEMNHGVKKRVDLIEVNATVAIRKNVHDSLETVFDFPDRDAIIPIAVRAFGIVGCQDDVDTFRIFPKVLTTGM